MGVRSLNVPIKFLPLAHRCHLRAQYGKIMLSLRTRNSREAVGVDESVRVSRERIIRRISHELREKLIELTLVKLQKLISLDL